MAIEFVKDKYIRKSELKRGGVYIWKDDDVRVFLGFSGNSMAFYTIGKLYTIIDYTSRRVKILHGDTQLKMIIALCKEVLNSTCNSEAIYRLHSMPQIRGMVYDVGEEYIVNWLNKNVLLNKDTLPNIHEKEVKNFVASKDLKPGCIYYGGNTAWRNTFCYLGRTIDNRYAWCFIGNDELFKRDPKRYITSSVDIDITKNNKKVRLLDDTQNSYLAGFQVNIDDAFKNYLRPYVILK